MQWTKWDLYTADVKKKMGDYWSRIVTPLAIEDPKNGGQAIGTGTYIRLGDDDFLLTADHVLIEARGRTLAHLPIANGYFHNIDCFRTKEHPIDAAVAPIKSWPDGADRTFLLHEALGEFFDPVENEVLFGIGHPATTKGRNDPVSFTGNRVELFNTINTPAFPFLCLLRQNDDFEDSAFNSRFHFLIDFPETSNPPHSGTFVNPAGLSGSLIWDTKARRAWDKNESWEPEMARVCGLVIRATMGRHPQVLIATKVECLQSFFRNFGLIDV